MCKLPNCALSSCSMAMWPASRGILMFLRHCSSGATATNTTALPSCGTPFRKGPGLSTLLSAYPLRRHVASSVSYGLELLTPTRPIPVLRSSSLTPKSFCWLSLATPTKGPPRGVLTGRLARPLHHPTAGEWNRPSSSSQQRMKAMIITRWRTRSYTDDNKPAASQPT